MREPSPPNHRHEHPTLALLRLRSFTLFATSRVTLELLELRNLTQVGWIIIDCALRRHESRGLHYNLDYPERDDARCLNDTVI